MGATRSIEMEDEGGCQLTAVNASIPYFKITSRAILINNARQVKTHGQGSTST